jgi:hypothetical protein
MEANFYELATPVPVPIASETALKHIAELYIIEKDKLAAISRPGTASSKYRAEKM